jgi:hypothetical protein
MRMDGSPEDSSLPGDHLVPVSMSCSEVQSETIESTSESSVSDEDDDSGEDGPSVAEMGLPPEPCKLCGQTPCDWISFGDQISEECDEMMEQNQPNKQIHYHAYQLYTWLRFGGLCKHDRRPLPVCVCGEIMDSYPDPNHQYVGFHAALNDVAVVDDDT